MQVPHSVAARALYGLGDTAIDMEPMIIEGNAPHVAPFPWWIVGAGALAFWIWKGGR